MPDKMPSTFNTFLRARRSIRKFNGQRIPAEVLREILETATFAPSAHGLQPWRFVLVESENAKSALGKALTEQMRSDMKAENAPKTEIRSRAERSLRRIAEAPHIVLLCRDSQAVRAQSHQEDLMSIQSVAMAGLQLMLAAHARGLGSNWICWPLYAQAETIRALDLPKTWEPQGMVFLGYPVETPQPKQLQALENIICTL